MFNTSSIVSAGTNYVVQSDIPFPRNVVMNAFETFHETTDTGDALRRALRGIFGQYMRLGGDDIENIGLIKMEDGFEFTHTMFDNHHTTYYVTIDNYHIYKVYLDEKRRGETKYIRDFIDSFPINFSGR